MPRRAPTGAARWLWQGPGGAALRITNGRLLRHWCDKMRGQPHDLCRGTMAKRPAGQGCHRPGARREWVAGSAGEDWAPDACIAGPLVPSSHSAICGRTESDPSLGWKALRSHGTSRGPGVRTSSKASPLGDVSGTPLAADYFLTPLCTRPDGAYSAAAGDDRSRLDPCVMKRVSSHLVFRGSQHDTTHALRFGDMYRRRLRAGPGPWRLGGG